jgi:hypothetical protein
MTEWTIDWAVGSQRPPSVQPLLEPVRPVELHVLHGCITGLPRARDGHVTSGGR